MRYGTCCCPFFGEMYLPGTPNRYGGIMSDSENTQHKETENRKPAETLSAGSVNLREVVLDILLEHEMKGTYSNVLIRRAQERYSFLPLTQRSFIKRLAEGTIERQIELDEVIDRHRKNKEATVKLSVRCILRMSIYQIYYMDGVTDYAACNEAVRLCRRRHLESQAGFVNALLRTVCREKEANLREGKDAAAPRPKQLRTRPSDAAILVARRKPEKERQSPAEELPASKVTASSDDAAASVKRRIPSGVPDSDGTLRSAGTGAADSAAAVKPGGAGQSKSAAAADAHMERLSRRYSIPAEILELWQEQLGEERLEPLCRSMLEIRPVCIRLNSRLTDEEKEHLVRSLEEAGVRVQPGRWEPDCRYLWHITKLTELPGFAEGLWTVQDESSQLTAHAAGLKGRRGGDIREDAVILDLCAAPGGKTILAAMERPEGRILSYDLSREKTDRIRANVRRMQLSNVTVGENDASNPREDLKESADLVICDVPCSGLGVMTRKRDIKYNVTAQKLRSLTVLQRRIALNAAQMVKPGGVLLYSTCTINRLENERIAGEIARRTGLEPENLASFLPEDFPGIGGNCVQLFPDVHGTDGFFMARFRRPL